MATKAALKAQSAVVTGFESPKVSLEQYPMPPGLAIHLVHLANLRGDVESAMILSLGSGTEMPGPSATFRSPARVVGVELNDDALVATTNSVRRVGASVPVDWVRTDATRLSLCLPGDRRVTAFMNPPSGAQRGNEHTDRTFLDSVAPVTDVPYSVHNGGGKEFVESFAADAGGDLTDAFQTTSNLDRQFDFHGEDRRQLDAEALRIEW